MKNWFIAAVDSFPFSSFSASVDSFSVDSQPDVPHVITLVILVPWSVASIYPYSGLALSVDTVSEVQVTTDLSNIH